MIGIRPVSQLFTVAVFFGIVFNAAPALAEADIRERDGERFAFLNINSYLSRAGVISPAECDQLEGKRRQDDKRECPDAAFGGLVYQVKGKRITVCPSREELDTSCSRSLADWQLQLRDLYNLRVASLGEGEPNIVLDMLAEGVDVYAVDIDKSYRDQTVKHFSNLQGRIIHGDAAYLSMMRFALGGLDHVVSSHLFCAINDKANIEKVLFESLRALKPGGTARHQFHVGGLDPHGKAFEQSLKNTLELARRFEMEIEYVRAHGRIEGEDPADGLHEVLLFKRVK